MSERLRDWIRDGVAVTGLLLMAWGLGMVYLPAAFIVPGALLFGLAISKRGGDADSSGT